MTQRERFVAVGRGEPVDRKPLLNWPSTDQSGDVLVVPPVRADIVKAINDSDRLILAEITNPFFRGRDKGLLEILQRDPADGDRLLTELKNEVKADIETSLDAGADGIFYRVHGATPQTMSPMAFGGHFLEVDRELLYLADNARFNVAFVVGESGVYLDFVSDLPVQAMGWDADASGINAAEMRTMRPGALASTDPESDILIETTVSNLSQYLENQPLAIRV